MRSLARDLTAHDHAPPNKVEILDEDPNSVPLDRLRCPDLRRFHDIWTGLERDARGLPPWCTFSHALFKHAFDKLCLLKVRDWRTDDFEFGLFGGHPSDYLNGGRQLDLCKLRADPLGRGNYEDIKQRVGHCVETGNPGYTRKTLSWKGMGYIEYELIFLPFAPGSDCQRILAPVTASARATA